MRISDLFKMGLRNLFRRKTRTILTTLGVVIGSLCIIITVSIGNGVNDSFEKSVMTQGGLTSITVSTYASKSDEDGNWTSSEQVLDDNLVEQIKALDHVRACSPIIGAYVGIYAGKFRGDINLAAMDLDTYEDFDFPELEYGTYPTDEDNTSIIFGYNQPYQFYNPNSYSGWNNSVEIDMQKEKMVLKFEEYQTAEGKKEYRVPLLNVAKMVQTNSDFDFYTYVDIDYFKEVYLKYCRTLSVKDRKKALKTLEEYTEIKLNVDNINNVEGVQKKIEELGFQSYSMAQYLMPLKKASQNIQLILLVMGIIVMIASAISIANTMVMSIYERTKEIGIMKVLGCMVGDVRKLFLFEASIIGLLGGLIGIILGFIASWAINKYGAPIFSTLMTDNFTGDMTNTKFSIIPIYLPFLSLSISIGVALLSGYFPARRATKIKSIEAMKTEG